MARRASNDNLVKLSRAGVAAITLAPGQSERIVWDTEVPGFGVRLRSSGNAVWVIRPARMGGRSKVFTLGAVNVLSLTEARNAARERLAKATLGDDPHAARREARKQAVVTVGGEIARYIEAAETKLRPTTFYNLKNHLNVHWAPLHTYSLNGVKRADVAARLSEIAKENGPHAANRARVVLSGFFSWCLGEGVAETNPTIGTNKAAPETVRSRVLSDVELVKVWQAVVDDDFGRILKLLILTGQRRDEVAGVTWSELDLAGGLWTLPAERSKNHRPHEIPLSDAARTILSAVPVRENRDLVFGSGAGPFTGFGHAKARLDRKIGIKTPWRIHDLRRTTATRMGKLGVLPHVVEAVLNHVSGHKAGVAGVYNYAPYEAEKRAALDAWATHVAALTA